MSGLSKTEFAFTTAFREIQTRMHRTSIDSGFWEEQDGIEAIFKLQPEVLKHVKDMMVAQKLCLIHSEISEGLEGHRKELMDTHLPNRTMLEVELADAIIRIMDLAERLYLDVADAIIEKAEFNRTRPHKHGKAY